MEAYITKRILLERKLTYQLWTISVSAQCLPGNFGMANEVTLRLTVDPVPSFLFPRSPFPSVFTLRGNENPTVTDY